MSGRPHPTPRHVVLMVPMAGPPRIAHVHSDWHRWLGENSVAPRCRINLPNGVVLHFTAHGEEPVNERATALTTRLGPTVQVHGGAAFVGMTAREVLDAMRPG